MKATAGYFEVVRRAATVLTGVAVAFVFLLAGISKLDDPTLTIGFISFGFDIPANIARWLVYLLGIGEMALAVLMVRHVGRRSWPAGVAFCVVAFFVGLLISVALRFPNKSISCACFGSLQPPLGGASILSQLKFDGILVILLAIHLIAGPARETREEPCTSEPDAATA